MRRILLTILGVLATMTGLASSVNAQSVPNSARGEFTLSGDSLVGLQNRNAEDDYAEFFAAGDDLAATSSNFALPDNDIANNNIAFNQNFWIDEPNRADWELTDDLNIAVGEADREPVDAIPFEGNVADDDEAIQVLLQVPL